MTGRIIHTKKEGENSEHGSVTYSDGIVIIDAFFEASPEALKEITKDVADLIKKYEK